MNAQSPSTYSAANEPVLSYRPGSAESAALRAELAAMRARSLEIPLVIGGVRHVTGSRQDVVCPHDHHHVLASSSQADIGLAGEAVDAAVRAQKDWRQRSLAERSEVFLKAADLLAGPWRQRLNAATMLGQSKSVHQAEIDAACELIDFLRFNVQFAYELERQQPRSADGATNAIDYRPLEGFVYAVTPFNFTAIGGNLATAPVLMGNAVVWKPSAGALLSNYLFLELLEEAGLPPGVINFIPGDPQAVSRVALSSHHLAGVHFTGSTAVFDQLWQSAAHYLPTYRNYPRLVGETGGKDFVLAHASADVEALVVGLVRGAFEYQGQKCSAASRAYIPRSLWPKVKAGLLAMVASLKMGDTADFTTFMGAVIDRRAYDRIVRYLDAARDDASVSILVGGKGDDSVGYFVAPTVIEVTDPGHVLMREEIFGPVLAVYVYEDADWSAILERVDETGPYGLTGAVFAQDSTALESAGSALRFSAGNFYINDKPTGAVVGQQPFGGGRRSGTNDKAGSFLNLVRWTSPRTVKTTHEPPRDYRYPHMAAPSEPDTPRSI